MVAYRDPPRFRLGLITPPTVEPIELQEAMEHLNIELDDRRMDSWLNNNIRTAREYCEGYRGQTLAPQTLEVSFGGHSQPTTVPTYWQPLALNPWPDSGNFIELPMGPVISVESVSYRDAVGDLQVIGSADYELFGDELSGSWPSVQAARNAIRIRYVAGYTLPDDSPSPYPLPYALRAAMLLMLGHLYKNREATVMVVGATPQEIPLGAKDLMDLCPGKLRLGMA